MSADNAEASKAPTVESAVTVNSPTKRAPEAHAQVNRQSGPPRTEHPVDPPNPTKAFTLPPEESASGNPTAILSLKLEGQLGVFYPRASTVKRPTHVDISFPNIRGAANRVLTFVLTELAQKQKELDNTTLNRTVRDIANHLSNGICVMTYMKLHSINYNDERVAHCFRLKPKVPAPFEVPSPYALAISQLGAIKLSGMAEEKFFIPSVPAGNDEDFGCTIDYHWSPVVYSRYVVLAKKLGIQFSTVDLDVKMGSSWWLYRPVNEGDAFRFDCPFPEENFTLNTVVLAALFANGENGQFNNRIIDLAPLGDDTYCSMLRRCPPQISINCYYAISEEKEIVYLVKC